MSFAEDALNDEEARMYASEKEDNFRWVAKWAATTSGRVLRDDDRVDSQIEEAVSALAEFAEIAHGSMDPVWILDPQNRKILARDGFPLADGYRALGSLHSNGEVFEDIRMVQRFKGTIGSLQGYTALRMNPLTAARESSRSSGSIKPQVILAFSGSSSLIHGIYNLMTVPVQYQPVSNTQSDHDWRVHDGFQRVYLSVRDPAIQALNLAIKHMNDAHKGEWDLVITGHSLGTAVSSLFLLDLMRFEDVLTKSGIPPAAVGADTGMPVIPLSTNVTIAKFGPPRVVNSPLVDEYKKQVRNFRDRRQRDKAFTDWAVIGYMDGVPSVPPMKFGYAHLCRRPFYLYHGKLYHVPEGEREYGLFTVVEANNRRPLHPKGGHNYYGARDMERLQRRMKGLMADVMTGLSNSYRPPLQSPVGSSRGTARTPSRKQSQSQQDNPPWVQAYVARERDEKLAWINRPPVTGRSHWGLLRSILPGITRFS